MCITYCRCSCNKLWRCSEFFNIETTEVNIPSTKQLLNKLLGRFSEKLKTIFGARVNNELFIKKRCSALNRERSLFRSESLNLKQSSINVRKLNLNGLRGLYQ